jgi:signal transduction histidine kinase
VTSRAVTPTRLRRRLAVAFVLAVAVATGGLALGSFLIVKNARLNDSARQAVNQSVLTLRFAASQPAPPELLFDAFQTRGRFSTVLLRGRLAQQSGAIGVGHVPLALRQLVDSGQIARDRVTISGRHEVVVGGPLPGTDEQFYFFYDEQQVWDDLDTLRNVLAGGWLVLVVLAALVGTVLARRTLAPVAQASDAARLLAEGLLDTRLPVAGDDEFGAWAASFNQMAEALQTKIDALAEAQAREQRFTANVAHELVTPLTGIVGETRLLAEEADEMPAKSRLLAGLLVDDVERLRRLTEDLLEISRLDAGSEPEVDEPVDVGASVRGVVGASGWQDRVAVSADHVVIQSDPRRFDRIVANLIGNAVRHGGSGVRVRVARDGAEAVVEVADDGPGIPPEALPHIFDRFFKADPSRGGGGSGLGLAIAHENAKLLGGAITATSTVGRGSVFTLRLSVAKPLSDRDRSVASATDDKSDMRHSHRETP